MATIKNEKVVVIGMNDRKQALIKELMDLRMIESHRHEGRKLK